MKLMVCHDGVSHMLVTQVKADTRKMALFPVPSVKLAGPCFMGEMMVTFFAGSWHLDMQNHHIYDALFDLNALKPTIFPTLVLAEEITVFCLNTVWTVTVWRHRYLFCVVDLWVLRTRTVYVVSGTRVSQTHEPWMIAKWAYLARLRILQFMWRYL